MEIQESLSKPGFLFIVMAYLTRVNGDSCKDILKHILAKP
jgi:hypothetical protein